MNKRLHELFYAFWDAGIALGFGRDAYTNIPYPFDPTTPVGTSCAQAD